MDIQAIVIVTIVAALIFDVINGFHDAANSIATVVSTRVLSPRVAVLWAATFNFVALFIFHQGVADTIAKDRRRERSERFAELHSAIHDITSVAASRIEQDRAIAQRALSELHPALEPAHDLPGCQVLRGSDRRVGNDLG